MKSILCFFGTRPEAIKMAPLIRELKKSRHFRIRVCVSAQHRKMLDQVLDHFDIRAHYDLGIMREKQSLFEITTRALRGLEPVLKREKPDLILLHGDTTTTLAGALAAHYLQIPVGHVEAGLRTHSRYQPFPEEMNRTLTDALSSIHFAPTSEARSNLLREGISHNSIYVTGNTVIDAFLWVARQKHEFQNLRLSRFMRQRSQKDRILFLTAHRRENLGRRLKSICQAVRRIARLHPNVHWIYPVHLNPYISRPVQKHLSGQGNVLLLPPLNYPDTVHAIQRSYAVITDSGGLQEEAPALGKPVLVLREVTERPEAVQAGTVQLVGTDSRRIQDEAQRILEDPVYWRRMANATNPYGDGQASRRILETIEYFFGLREAPPRPFTGTF